MESDPTVNTALKKTGDVSHHVCQLPPTKCCIVGCGPAGAILGFLLARKGIDVTVFEAARNLDRDFRGDTIHPSTMEILDQLDLAEELLQLPHYKIHNISFEVDSVSVKIADFSRLKTKFPYVVMMPQAQFLEFLTSKAKQYSNFKLVMDAHVHELIMENETVVGVRYSSQSGWSEVHSLLVIGADGRSSTVRRLAGLEPITTSPPMDVVWFRVPRDESNKEDLKARIKESHIVLFLNRGSLWQVAWTIPKGTFHQLRSGGLDKFKELVAEVVPEIAQRLDSITQWSQVAFLSVESNRLKKWYVPRLLLIGDAAHTMSPIGGVGINYAIQDAVVSANVLFAPLEAGIIHVSDLAKVQRRRELSTRVVQGFQTMLQKRIVSNVLRNDKRFKLPLLIRMLFTLPYIRNFPVRLIAFGLSKVRIDEKVVLLSNV